MKTKILVVGAGFAGATVARELANTGDYEVDVIDRRHHVAGNAYDVIHEPTGNRYHKYGPHIFHTNDKRIFEYLSRFTEWLPYTHRVEAFVEGVGDVPLPVNLITLNKLYGVNLTTEEEVSAFLFDKKVAIEKPANAHEYLLSIYGERITNLFFAGYTKKMWNLTLRELPVSVVARLPIRSNANPNYFNDEFQFMPAHGYESLMSNMLDHDSIHVHLNESFDDGARREYHFTFNSMPIDEYFDNCFGELPYRSIKFEHRAGEEFIHTVPTLNFTDDRVYTRKTNWELYPGCGGGRETLVTYETPCDYRENNYERYYPVKTVDGGPQAIYREYANLAKQIEDMCFVGRCGQYIYYDMHQVVANSLMIVAKYSEADTR